MKEYNKIFKNSALLAFLIKKLREDYPEKQIGKTVIQKMCYFLTRNKIFNYDYGMYFYGPYSFVVSGELDFAQDVGIIKMNWFADKGYEIDINKKNFEFVKDLIGDEEKKEIKKIIKDYGKFNANELSFIATSYFLKDKYNSNDEELLNDVSSIKYKFEKSYIKDILIQASVINK